MPAPFASHHDPPAELALLAALQQTPTLVWGPVGQLTPDLFTEGRGATYAALVSAAQAELPLPQLVDAAPAADPVAVAGHIRNRAQARVLDAGLATLGRVLDRAQAQPAAVADALAAFEAAVARARQVGTPAAGLLVAASDLLAGIVAEAQQRAEQRAATGSDIMGIPTGFSRLDDLLNGLEPGLLVLAGQPGMGKTTLANLIAANVAAQGTPVLYVTYENSRENLILKHLCRMAGISETDARRGKADPVVLGVMAQAFGARAGCLYYVEASAETTVEGIGALGLQVKRRHLAEQVLVVVDYLQKMAHTAGYDELRANVGKIAAQLRDLSRTLASPVLALASLNRGGYATQGGEEGGSKKRPNMANLKESGDIEYGADVVVMLSEGEGDGPPLPDARPVALRIEKNRGGPAGTSVRLVFRPARGDFAEQAPVGMNGSRR